MYEDDFGAVQRMDTKLSEQKSLLVGISRGLRDLQRSRGAIRPGEKPKLRPGNAILRNAVAELLRPMRTSTGGGIVFEKSATEIAQRIYGGDHDLHARLERIEKAAALPAGTTTVGYASELVQSQVFDFLAGDTPSGFVQLAGQALRVDLGTGKIPSRVYPLSLSGSWTAEGSPKPVYTVPLTSITVSPSKLTCIHAWSEEIANYSTPSIERLVQDAVTHDLNALVDSAAFDAAASSSLRPAGLWNAATAVTPSALTPASEAMAKDLAALSAAVSANAPSAKVVFVMNPAQSLRLTLNAPAFGVVTSGYMAAGSVGAIDSASIVTMIGDLQFRASSNATIHMSDTPLPIATGAQGSAVAATPVTSAFQADLIALRSVLFVGWAKRRTGATALATAVTW